MNSFSVIELLIGCGFCFVIGLSFGIFHTRRFYISCILGISTKTIYELYNNKRENCPQHLFERIKRISGETSPYNTQKDKEHIHSEDTVNPSIKSGEMFNNTNSEPDCSKSIKHYDCCCGYNHTLTKCCEINKEDIIKIIQKIITGKQNE
jgi:hypothetical protein